MHPTSGERVDTGDESWMQKAKNKYQQLTQPAVVEEEISAQEALRRSQLARERYKQKEERRALRKIQKNRKRKLEPSGPAEIGTGGPFDTRPEVVARGGFLIEMYRPVDDERVYLKPT
jgi:hypothetical protein